MKVGLLQIDIAWENKAANFNKVESFAKKAKEQEVDLIVLPELFSTGFTLNSKPLAEELSGETPSFLSKLSKDYNISVLGSFIEKTEAKPKNSAILFNENGSLIYHYSKIHLFSYDDEDKHYSPGMDISTFELHQQKLSAVICYDLRFPEIFRELVDKGVKCVFVIASWPVERVEHWDFLLKARAVDNQIFIAGVNRVGESPRDSYPGHSAVVDPFARVIASAQDNEEDIIICDIDFSLVDKIREEFPILNDRRM